MGLSSINTQGNYSTTGDAGSIIDSTASQQSWVNPLTQVLQPQAETDPAEPVPAGGAAADYPVTTNPAEEIKPVPLEKFQAQEPQKEKAPTPVLNPPPTQEPPSKTLMELPKEPGKTTLADTLPKKSAIEETPKTGRSEPFREVRPAEPIQPPLMAEPIKPAEPVTPVLGELPGSQQNQSQQDPRFDRALDTMNKILEALKSVIVIMGSLEATIKAMPNVANMEIGDEVGGG